MPHKEVNWRVALPDMQRTIQHERAAAQEWKKVAEARLVFLQHIDRALAMMMDKATAIERVFNVDAPRVELREAPLGSSGEEIARHVRIKMSALVSFTGNLAQEALAAEQTIVDVYAIAQEAAQTHRPTADVAPTWREDDFDPSAWGFLKEDVAAALSVSSPLDLVETTVPDLASANAIVALRPLADSPAAQMLGFLNGTG